MDLMQIFMNFVAPPISFITLLLVMPVYFFFKFSHYMLRSIFSENLAGKVVLITGASSGIGEALAYQYAKRGAHLVLVARRKNALQEVAERARSCGSGDVLVIRADVSDVDDCKRFIDKAVGHFGRLDHLVNNAGITSVTMVEDSTNITNFRALMDTNFWGSVYPTYFAIPHLKKSRGKIVVTASVARWLPAPRLAFYNASKAAVAIFYEALRSELGSEIGITIVTPGLVESEMTKGKFFTNEGKMEVDQELRDVGLGPTPVMHVEDCANAIVNSVCKGDRNVVVPSWYNIIHLWQMFCPEVVEWFLRLMVIPMPGQPNRETLNKKITDATGAKNFLYPPSILSPVQGGHNPKAQNAPTTKTGAYAPRSAGTPTLPGGMDFQNPIPTGRSSKHAIPRMRGHENSKKALKIRQPPRRNPKWGRKRAETLPTPV